MKTGENIMQNADKTPESLDMGGLFTWNNQEPGCRH